MQPMTRRFDAFRVRRLSRLIPFVLLAAASAGCGKGRNPFIPVILPPLSAVVLTPTTDSLQVGQGRAFNAVAYDTAGAPVANAGFAWTSSDEGVLTVSSTGFVNAVGEGLAIVIAAAGGMSDTAVVFVRPTATGWNVQASGGTTNNLHGVFFQPDGRHGFAVGETGTVVSTDDAGVTWSAQSATTFSLYGVWFTGPSEGWAVGNSGTVLHTTNGGTSWTRLTNVGAGENLRDVYFATRDTGWAVGSAGAIVRTFDRGASWQKVNPTGNTLNSVAFTGTRDGWAVGEGGVIVGTHDRGLSWFIVQPTVTGQALKAVWRRSATQAWAAGSQGLTPRTVVTPDSTAWELRNAGAANQLEGVFFPTGTIGFAVGYSGTGAVLRSDDGGTSWNAQAANTSVRLNDVFFVDALRGWAVGDGGKIIHTATGGN